jgi:simple sugar transport system ATP-binding protein
VVAASPTRGLDVGATEFVRKTLVEQAGRGAAVLLISEDLDEVMELSDRIAVFYGGQVAGVVKAAGADRLAIGELMTGAAT